MKSKNKHKVLLVGLGRIASLLEKDPFRTKPCTHAGTLLSPWGKKNFSLAGIWDKDTEKVKSFEKQWKLKFPLIEPKDWKNQGFDLCVIATPSTSHTPLAKTAMESGIRRLLVEKPVGVNPQEAKELLSLAQKSRALVWVNHERRFSPIYQFVKNGLEEEKWGTVRTVKASVLTSRLSPGYAYQTRFGGPLLHDGTHAIDLLLWMFGKPKVSHSTLTQSDPLYKIEEQALATLEFPRGIFGFLEAGGYRNYFQFEIDIQTSQARIVLSNDGHKLYLSKSSQLYKGFLSLKESSFPKKLLGKSPFPHLYKEIHDSFSTTVNKKSPFKITGSLQDSIDILDIIQSIYKKGKKNIVSSKY